MTRKKERTNGTTKKGRVATLPDWTPAFLASFRLMANIQLACKAAGVGRTTFYTRRDRDPAFREEINAASKEATETLEAEAWRRGRDGVSKPVIHQGVMSGVWIDDAGQQVEDGTPGARFIPLTVKEYSDTLLIFLLKARDPKRYRERLDLTHKGKVAVNVRREELARLSYDQLKQIETIMSASPDADGSADGTGPT